MPNVLLEIGLEEVPARFIDNCLADLRQLIETNIIHHRLDQAETTVTSEGTYRRFAFIIRNLKDQQEDIDQVLHGPPIAIAQNENGEWQGAAEGFAKKCGVSVSDLTIIANEKGQDVVSARQFQKGQAAIDLLPIIFKDSIQKMKLPIAMVWGDNIGPFIRPVQWVCALVDNRIIELELFGVQSSNKSYGHRFLTDSSQDMSSGEVLELNQPLDYLDILRAAKVIVSVDERKTKIKDQLLRLMNESDIESALLNEVTHLVEWPTVLEVSFPDTFLALPTEVLTECLRKHQKAFVILENGTLKNASAVVSDSVTEANVARVIEGNQRVLLARLNDVQFFWSEDLAADGFHRWNNKLHDIVFQEGLGSIADKVERICHICHVIGDQLELSKDLQDSIDRAAHRCKADLVTQMVTELPGLQGVMGGYYAQVFKEMPEVSGAIRDHYKPRFDGDEFPETIIGTVIAIADRIDTMVACFENNAIPTGSRDPWGIRRSMIAIVRMVIAKRLNVNIVNLIEAATLSLGKEVGENTKQCIQFFNTRCETVFAEVGISHDIIQLFSNRLLASPFEIYNQANALIEVKKSNADQYQLLLETTSRVAKIIHSFDGEGDVKESHFEHDIEQSAFQLFQALKTERNPLVLNADGIGAAVSFCQTLSQYFEDVLVNAEDQIIANNRRLFIKSVDDYFSKIGDWVKLQK